MTLDLPLHRTVTIDTALTDQLKRSIPEFSHITVQRTDVCHYIDVHLTRPFAQDTAEHPHHDVYFHIRAERAMRSWLAHTDLQRLHAKPSMIQYRGGGHYILTYTLDTSTLTADDIIDLIQHRTTLRWLHLTNGLDILIAQT